MTTDLTDGSELSEEEFAWDVFAPDPDESEIAAEAAALEDEDELNLDDSHLDWEAAMRDPETMGGPEGEARAGAAYDRIVDTVRRSFEEPENSEGEVDEASAGEARAGEASVDEVVGVAAPLEAETAGAPGVAWLDLDDGMDGNGVPAPATWQDAPTETERGPWVPTSGAAPFEPIADSDGQGRGALRATPSWEEPDLGWEPAWEPAAEPEASEVPTFEPDAATAFALAPPTWAPELESEPEAAPAVAPALPADASTDAGTDVDTTVDVAALAGSEADADVIEDDPSSAPKKSRGRKKDRERRPRSRIYTATVVLACLVLVVIAGIVAVRALRHPASTAPAAKTAPPAAAPVSPSPAAARMQSATDAVDSATTAAQVGLTSLSDLATTSNVAKVIYPYISSLQLYESVLADGAVPAPARSAAANAASEVRQELTFLDTISTLPQAQLGAYLQQFGTDATQLQATLSALEQDLTKGS